MNAIPEAGMAEPVADQIALAPRAQDLSEEDCPVCCRRPRSSRLPPLAVAPGSAGIVTPPPVLPSAASAPVIEDFEQSVADTASGEDLESVLAAAAEAPVVDPALATEAVAEEAADPLATTDAPVENPAVAKSLWPPPRPAKVEHVAATAAASTAAPGPAAPPRVVDPAT